MKIFPLLLLATMCATSFALNAQNVNRDEAKRHRHLQLGTDLLWIGDRWVADVASPDIAWTELVSSWELNPSASGNFEIFLIQGGERFSLGRWGLDPAWRRSFDGQQTAGGVVYTDTFVTRRPGSAIRIEIVPQVPVTFPPLESLWLSFSAGVPAPSAWSGREIAPLPVPIRAQGDYPNGGVLCSPTCVSMVLQFWAAQSNRPELDADVPAVQTGVFDPTWGGTGNWPFNTAFASARPGLSARVARLRDLNDLEDWLRHGVPVITSVSYDLLKGKPTKGENDGHLVIVVGVDASGQLIFNDPGRKPVRLVYDRSAFERAWATSRNTVYLVHPRHWVTPVLP